MEGGVQVAVGAFIFPTMENQMEPQFPKWQSQWPNSTPPHGVIKQIIPYFYVDIYIYIYTPSGNLT